MLVPLGTATALMAVMATKHFVADFLLQTEAIARGKAAARGWVWPLVLHAGGHAVLTLIVALAICPAAWWTAPVEFVVHGGIDRLKVIYGQRAKLDLSMSAFWWLFGFDQFLHQMTNVAIISIFLRGEA